MIAFLFTVALICPPRGGNDCFFVYGCTDLSA